MGDESEEINYLGILGSHKCKGHENDETCTRGYGLCAIPPNSSCILEQTD